MSDYWYAVGEQPAGQRKHLDLSKLCKKRKKRQDTSVQGSSALNQENSRFPSKCSDSLCSITGREQRSKLWRKSNNLKDQRYGEHFTRDNTQNFTEVFIIANNQRNVNYNHLEDILYPLHYQWLSCIKRDTVWLSETLQIGLIGLKETMTVHRASTVFIFF